MSRELRRNCTHMYDIPTYYPYTAQKKYLLRRSYCHRGMFQDPIKLEYIKEKLLLTWSPEQISNTPCELEMPSTRTIYRWIYDKYIDVNLKVLRRKGRTKLKPKPKGKYKIIIPNFCEFFNRCSKMNTTPIILPDVRPFRRFTGWWYVYPRSFF